MFPHISNFFVFQVRKDCKNHVFRLKCSRCKSSICPRKGSFFEGSRVPFKDTLLVYRQYCFGHSRASVHVSTGVSPTTLSLLKEDLCRLAQWSLTQSFIADEGTWDSFEVDETVVSSKRKYNRGARTTSKGTAWMLTLAKLNAFGKPEKYTGVMVPDRKHESLIPTITYLASPGARIKSDQLATYRVLGSAGYEHHTVNHSKNYKDPITGVK
jgi:hypothetical protein